VNPKSLRRVALLSGSDTNHDEPRLLREISLASDESAAELVEVYAKALLREEKLGAYTGSLVNAILAALNAFGTAFAWGYDAAGARARPPIGR